MESSTQGQDPAQIIADHGKMLARVDGVDAGVAGLDVRIEELIAPFCPGSGLSG
jgi:hypothetical protein